MLGLTLEDMVAEAEAAGDEPAKGRIRFSDVQDGPELVRIANLPRRPIPDPASPEVEELTDFLVQHLTIPGVELYPGRPKPVQSLALKEAFEARGLAAMIKVGGGKTLISGLLPTVLQVESALLLTKGDMARDAEVELAKMRRCWKMLPPGKFRVMNYETLAAPANSQLLGDDGKTVVRKSLIERIRPQLLILDEAHCAGDTGTTTSKTINAFLEKNPETIVCCMSGTFFKTSIKDGQRLMQWALKDNCPLPCDFEEREVWANYLDAKRSAGPRAGEGALTVFLGDAEAAFRAAEEDVEDQRSIMRRALARWMLETPGIIGTQDPPPDTGLVIEAIYPEEQSPEVDEAFRLLRGDGTEEAPGWQLPDGEWVADGIRAAAHGITEGYGYWNIFDPEPPDDYRFHGSHWNRWCSKAIRYNRKGIFSEAKMKDAVKRNIVNDKWTKAEASLIGAPQMAGHSRLKLWEDAQKAYKDTYNLREPPTVGRWLSDEAIVVARRWAEEHGGLIWVNSIPLGERLSQELGVPYYGQKALDARKRHITKHPPGTPAVASFKACGTGKNIQKIWSKNLWLCAPDEQALGRTHRPGQTAAVVQNWVYLGCCEHLKAFFNARATKAKFQEDMTLSPQKLRYGQVEMPSQSEMESWAEGDRTSRWSRPLMPGKKSS